MLHSRQQASKSFTSFILHPFPPFIWQAWNIEENVNKCFVVAGQVYEINLQYIGGSFAKELTAVACDLAVIYFIQKSILFLSVNVVVVCACVSKAERQSLCLCVYIKEDFSPERTPKAWVPTVS